MANTSGGPIVSLLAAATEILYGLGLGDRLVAISHECDFPAAAVGKPRITRSLVDSGQSSIAIDQQVKQLASAGKALYTVDRDWLVRLNPELIVTQAQCDVCAVSLDDVLRLVEAEPTLHDTHVVALNPQSLSDLVADIQRVADIAHVPLAGQRFVSQLQGRIDRVCAETSGIANADRPRVVCIEWIEPLMVAANWTPQLISMAGGLPGISEFGQYSTYAPWSSVLAYDPEVLVIAPCGFDLRRILVEASQVTGWRAWQHVSAVQQRRVFALDGNAYLNRCGPRLVDSLEILAHLFHPQRFSAPSYLGNSHDAWCVMEL